MEILLIIACVAIVGSVLTTSIIRKRKNKKSGGCSGCCGDCPYCSSCSSHSVEQRNK